MIAALFVETDGIYFNRPDVDPWDVTRDAMKYDGPYSVVSHPPCGPWGQLKHLCTKQDRRCAIRAVEQVRAFGGVLEHPRYSTLWRHCALPLPGELPDAFGGRTYEVRQVSWGHGCIKPTWLYMVGVPWRAVVETERSGGAPSHRMTNGPRGVSANTGLRRASAEMRRRTPPAFAEWLISLARAARSEAA